MRLYANCKIGKGTIFYSPKYSKQGSEGGCFLNTLNIKGRTMGNWDDLAQADWKKNIHRI